MRAAVAVLAAAAACSGGSSSTGPDRRAELLVALVDHVYLPTLRELAAETESLVTAVEDFCADPSSEALAAARDAWRSARRPLKRGEALRIGPIVDERLDDKLDFWPARTDDIDEELEGSVVLSADYVSSLGTTRRGFPVLEYVLFLELETLAPGGEADRGCTYATSLAMVIRADAGKALAAWEPGGGDFRAQVVEAGSGSDTYARLSEPISDTANAIFIAVEVAEGKKLAAPLGLRTGGDPVPGAVESPFADNAIADVRDSLDGALAAFTARGAPEGSASFSSVIAAVDEDLHSDVIDRFAECDRLLDAIPGTLASAVVDDSASVDAAFQCSKGLLQLLKADVATQLGVTPTFGDVDGD